MDTPDFGGWATKNDLLCSDGRTIRGGAFKHQTGKRVALVWHHQLDEPKNILGHAVLTERPEGMYAEAFFNDSQSAKDAKLLVQHGDINMLSIFANKLKQQGGNVLHGDIKEVSLVLASANPGAYIDSVNLAHGDGFTASEDEGIIVSGEELEFGDLVKPAPVADEAETDQETETETSTETNETETTDESSETDGAATEDETPADGEALAHAETDSEDASDDEGSGESVKDIIDTMNEKQKTVLEYLVGTAVAGSDAGDTATHSDTNSGALSHNQEGFDMTGHNVFEQNGATIGGATTTKKSQTLSHDQLQTIMTDAPKFGSLKESFLAHAEPYGIDDIEFLFPDARMDGNGISFISRRTEWVDEVLSGTKHAPFSRIKSLAADITADEARAKGYVKGTMKKDEVIKLLKRVTTPKTVYKKQKLDRDDIVDITEVDIITWLKAEMRLMLDEEIATAILIGDGREPDDDDKIDEDHIRPIAFDVDMYNTVVELDSSPTNSEIVDTIVRSRVNYKGTGTPTFFTTEQVLTNLILDKDTLGRRLYATPEELAAALRVKKVVPVETMERLTDVVGILVNLADYTVGADKGGEINTFDDFDIDFNQQKYLIETRISGALTKPKAAVTIKYNSGTNVTPNVPTFVSSTGVVTIPNQTGVVYKNDDTNAVLTAGAQTALAPGATLNVQASPAPNYSFPHNHDADWGFTRPLA